jgi:hypothetical protein
MSSLERGDIYHLRNFLQVDDLKSCDYSPFEAVCEKNTARKEQKSCEYRSLSYSRASEGNSSFAHAHSTCIVGCTNVEGYGAWGVCNLKQLASRK